MANISSDNVRKHEQNPPRRIPVVGIGASAGGLEAFKIFFSKMPSDKGIAFVLIPHLDPGHKSLMVEIISRYTKMPVIEVEDRMIFQPDHIYIVSPNRNLAVEGNELCPCEIPKSKGINMPVDFFFRSLATELNERAIGIILSGTMSDGTMGLRSVKEHGGMVIVQAPETAQHDGMPRNAINTGLVDFVLPIEEMPDAIVKFIAHPYMNGKSEVKDTDELKQVLEVIYEQTNYDFRCYKRNTLIRRTERRMGLHQIEKMADYLDILRREPHEAESLFKDLLIGVTGFFREEHVWERIGKEILPSLLKNVTPGIPLRMWIPGCSTGEEPYTLAILAKECAEKADFPFRAQLFGTDIDEEAIATARRGIYPESIAAHISPERLKKYFIKEDREYRIVRDIRESVVFAVQNLIGDAPFSALDLISCRNLLIYLEPEVQKKIIELFHFSLREGGCLILGNSETIGYFHNLFETVSKELRIYRSIAGQKEKFRIPILPKREHLYTSPAGQRILPPRKNLAQLLQNELLKQFAPAAVLINTKYEIIQLYGPTVNYLDLPQGDPFLDLPSIVKEGLQMKLRAAAHKAIKGRETVTVTNARVKRDGTYYPVQFEISPVKDKDKLQEFFIITFKDIPIEETNAHIFSLPGDGDELLVHQLEAELVSTREDLQNTIEELETSNEELKASNEEMMSMNEELQSSNEELETSKEELQSLNEELNTVNAELREKIKELELSNNDLINLMNSTEVATVFLDTKYTIRRFTPAAKHLFSLIPSDIGRPINDLAQRFSDSDLPDDIIRVAETFAPSMKTVETEEGLWYIRRILPFRTYDNRIDGLVLTFNDVTDLKKSEIELREKEAQLKENSQLMEAVLKHTHVLTAYFDTDLNFIWVNQAYADHGKHDPSFFVGKNHFDLYPNEENQAIFQKVLDTGEQFFASAKPFVYPDQPERDVTYWDWSLVPTKNSDGNVTGLVFTLSEVTDMVRAEEELREKEELLRATGRMAKVGGWELDIKTLTLKWTEEVYRIHEVNIDYEPDVEKAIEFYAPESQPVIREAVQKAIDKGEPFDLELQFITAKNNHLWVHAVGKAYQEYGKTKKILGTFQDISERRQAEDALRQSEERLKKVLEILPVGVWIADKEGTIIHGNTAGQRIWAGSRYVGPDRFHEYKAWWVSTGKRIIPDEWAVTRAVRDGESSLEEEIEIECFDGTRKIILNWAVPILGINNEIEGVVAVNQDISSRKISEEQIKASLKEKEILLREVHHRVKNNLAVVASLIQMQSEQTKVPDALQLFRDLHNRVMAMAMVHEDLYKSQNFLEIDFSDYLKRLTENIRQEFGLKSVIVKVADAENIFLNLSNAIPCGLIVAELVTNAFKHAFPPSHLEKEPEICVELQKADDVYTLIISDNGVGFPSDVDWRNTRTLGMELVQTWAEHQMGGKMNIESENGTRFIITFNE